MIDLSGLTLEALLTSPNGFGLTTATPVQRAICRASTGVPLEELAHDLGVIEAFGGEEAIKRLPITAPLMFCLLAGIRSAKSMLAAAKGFRACQIVDVSNLKKGEEPPRLSIVSVGKDQAAATFGHLRNTLLATPLRQFLIGEPTANSLWIRHPSGWPVEVRVVAGSKAGATLTSRWSAGIIFDEAPRMQGQEDGVVNLEDLLSSVTARLLDGAQIDLIGSPWAPKGPVYQLYLERFGLPANDVLVVKAPGHLMNPARFTPAFCAELEKRDPRAHKTDVLAEFADAEDSLLSSVDVQTCTRKDQPVLDPVANQEYVAAIDPATRGNAWTLVILTSNAPERYQVVLAKQWRGTPSVPRRPGEVLREIAEICRQYSIGTLWSDQYSYDALAELSEQHGLSLACQPFTQAVWQTLAERLRVLVSKHHIELPPDPVLRSDLLGIHRRLTTRASTIALSSTGDGRHGDYVPSLCLCLQYPPACPETPEVRRALTLQEQEDRLISSLQQPDDEMERFALQLGAA